MKVVARVFEYEIFEPEIQREKEKLVRQNLCLSEVQLLQSALARVIDRYLLLHEAHHLKISVCDEEYESALLELFDIVDSVDNIEELLAIEGMAGAHIEALIRNKITIKKYLQSLCCQNPDIDDERVRAFYEEQKQYFYGEQEIRASHILIKGLGENSRLKAEEMRKQITTPEQFIAQSSSCSDCPSNSKCGDLGYFKRGTLLQEIEDVAFNLKVGEISRAFPTSYGYHILMVTDIRTAQAIPFEEIKESLKARLIHIEKEYCLARHVNKLRQQASEHIIVI